MRIRSRLLTKLAAWLLVHALRVIYLTIRRDQEAFDPDTNAYNPHIRERYLYCIWHDSIIMPLFHARLHHMAGIVSGHQDGSYLAESMHYLNVKPVRGSSGKRGVRVLRAAIETTKDHHITITPDGPRGPRREMKDGIIFLASKSGRAIVPAAYRCSRAWRIRGSWTDLIVPKPFSRITMIVGEPIRIPEGIGREELAELTTKLQQIMDRLYARAESPDANHESSSEAGCKYDSAADSRRAA